MSSETKKIIVNFDNIKQPKQNKTRKNLVPAISPNHLKNELLQKIKHHKSNNSKTIVGEKKDEYTDEFCKSIDYLNNIKEKMHNNTTKKNVPSSSINSSSNNNSSSTNNNSSNNNTPNSIMVNKYVQLELPDELEIKIPSPIPQVQTQVQSQPLLKQQMQPQVQPQVQQVQPRPQVHTTTSKIYSVDKDVPHGCLKNGVKPCYRNWKSNQTRKNPICENDNLTTREATLQKIKQRMAEQKKILFEEPQNIQLHINEQLNTNTNTNTTNNNNSFVEKNNLTPPIQQPPPQNNKVFIKKTTIKKHELGKSSKYRKVGVLIKSKSTRKQITDAKKELSKMSIHEMKNQLQKQGLFKSGSTAPNDVIKQMYESSILAGEIKNTNYNVLYHNFLNEKVEN
jgi:hypothetical protein